MIDEVFGVNEIHLYNEVFLVTTIREDNKIRTEKVDDWYVTKEEAVAKMKLLITDSNSEQVNVKRVLAHQHELKRAHLGDITSLCVSIPWQSVAFGYTLHCMSMNSDEYPF